MLLFLLCLVWKLHSHSLLLWFSDPLECTFLFILLCLSLLIYVDVRFYLSFALLTTVDLPLLILLYLILLHCRIYTLLWRLSFYCSFLRLWGKVIVPFLINLVLVIWLLMIIYLLVLSQFPQVLSLYSSLVLIQILSKQFFSSHDSFRRIFNFATTWLFFQWMFVFVRHIICTPIFF